MDKRERAELFTRYVGLELKGKIIARGFNAAQVAADNRRSTAAFNRWLNGRVPIPLAVVYEACETIGVEPREIVESAYDRTEVELAETSNGLLDHGTLQAVPDLPAEVHGETPPVFNPERMAALKGDVEAEQEGSQETP